MLSKRVGKILTTEDNFVKGVVFEDGDEMECSCICFAVSTPEF
jgi:nitrite reductase (NAD(P)H)